MYLAQSIFDLPSEQWRLHLADLSVLCVSSAINVSHGRAKYVSTQMRHETSFLNEAHNARRCAQLLSQTPELRDDVYVPRVYGEAEGCRESDRIMVMEWIDGCR